MLFRVVLFGAFVVAAHVATGVDVSVWLSTQDGAKQMRVEPPLKFGADGVGDVPLIEIDPAVTYQSIVGLGSSWEHATCENLYRL